MTDDVFSVEQPKAPGVQRILRALTEDMVTLERKAESTLKLSKSFKAQKDEKAKTVVKMLTELGQTSTKWDDGLMVIRNKESYLSCPGEYAEDFEKWLKANGYWALAKVNAQTVKKLLRDRVAAEQPTPEYLRTFEKEGVQVRGKNAVKREGKK